MLAKYSPKRNPRTWYMDGGGGGVLMEPSPGSLLCFNVRKDFAFVRKPLMCSTR